MRYVLVDDEPRAVNLLKILLQQSEYFRAQDEIVAFTNALDAFQDVLNHPTDFLFLDIEMPILNGISFAHKLEAEAVRLPDIIFVTAYEQYSLNAWDTNAVGYILKPYDSKQLDRLLQKILRKHIPSMQLSETDLTEAPSLSLPHMRCFPDFEILVHNSPVSFQSKKAKELLAFLVHNRGNWVPIEKIIFNLLENGEETSSKNYCRTLTHRLKHALAQAGCEEILQSEYGKLRVDSTKFTCDYYDYLAGKINLFQGEYLEEYEWAETTKASMSRRLFPTL